MFGEISVSKLADLNKKSKELVKAMKRSQTKYKTLSEEALFLEDVIENAETKTHAITSSIRPPITGIFGSFLNTLVKIGKINIIVMVLAFKIPYKSFLCVSYHNRDVINTRNFIRSNNIPNSEFKCFRSLNF